jgi:hypothetical protein
MEGEELQLVASNVGTIHLEKTSFFGTTRRKAKSGTRHGTTEGIEATGVGVSIQADWRQGHTSSENHIKDTSKVTSSYTIPPQGTSNFIKPTEGASSSGIPSRGASTSGKPLE